MNDFSRFQNDFDNMEDADVDAETRRMERQLYEAEEWLEAVAAWEEAGKPRRKDFPTYEEFCRLHGVKP